LEDNQFIALLKDVASKKRFYLIPDEDLPKILKKAKLIETASDKQDIDFLNVINSLSEELDKRGLSQEIIPSQKISNLGKDSSTKTDLQNGSDKPFYYNSLDGMRALSVIAILIFHANSIWLKGGFLGVEVFFVISGFIITTLLLKEYQNKSIIDIKAFYKRRVRRLLPDMVFIIFSVLCFIVIVYPEEIKKTIEDILPSILYVLNWLYIYQDRSYFEITGRPRLLEHLWSLSVEFQYYLLWPIICLLLFRIKKSKAVLILILGAVISTWLMTCLYSPGENPIRVYFGTDTRASSLLIGSALALIMPEKKENVKLLLRYFLDLISVIAFLGIVLCFIFLDQTRPILYMGGFLFVSFLSAICIGISIQRDRGIIAKLLASKIMREIGVRAYNIYICHWPVFCLTQPFTDVPFDGLPLFLLRLVITGVLSEFSYRFIDIPVRNGLMGRIYVGLTDSTKKLTTKIVYATSIAVVTAIAIIMVQTIYEIASAGSSDIMPTEKTALVDFTDSKDESNGIKNAPVMAISSIVDQSLSERIEDNQNGKDSNQTHNPQLVVNKENIKPEMKGDVGSEKNIPFNYKTSPFKIELSPPPIYIARLSPKEEKKRKYFAIGDSVMLGAATTLYYKIGDINIDSKVGRHFAEAKKILLENMRKGILGDTLIIHIGNNGPINEEQLYGLMSSLKDVPKVYLVNLKVPRPYEKANNVLLEKVSMKFNNVILIDWHSESINITRYFARDGIHLTGSGICCYSNLLFNSIIKKT
jgi:peptidoglycan/LPS O-acetylase OafA/YrhL